MQLGDAAEDRREQPTTSADDIEDLVGRQPELMLERVGGRCLPGGSRSRLDKVYGKPYLQDVAFEVNFYKTAAGNEPVRDWLKDLDKGPRKTVGSDIWTVQVMWPMGKPLVDSFGKGMWEVRSTHDGTEYRVLFGIIGSTMHLLHGFVHKTKATPQADKNLGYSRLAEINAAEKAAKAKAKAATKKTKAKPS
jgi:phage-related protein